jgi:glycosyltransferase involved in cell wall biosynthesis
LNPFRIAFFINLDDQWTGGLSYYENLLRALHVVRDSAKIKLVGLFPQSAPRYESLYKYLDDVHVLPSPSFFNQAAEKLLSRLSPGYRSFFSFDTGLSKQARLLKTDVLFLRGDPAPQFRIPTLRWFPDFQYLHYPEMFTAAEVATLKQIVMGLAKHANRIILSSENSKKDFVQVVPEYIDKVRVLSFVSFIDESAYAINPRQICDEYHLPEKFFYLPNQFWKHKNHSLVIKALSLARRQNPDITIVSTGSLSDYRNPRYSSELMTEVSRSDNRNHFIFLGLVPREHLYALMRQSLAVIQPSLFEGWSTIVEEVKSLGKPILLSDLPVHREQNPPHAVYFSPFSPYQLAEALFHSYQAGTAGPNLDLENKAKHDLAERIKNFGNQFLEIAMELAS